MPSGTNHIRHAMATLGGVAMALVAILGTTALAQEKVMRIAMTAADIPKTTGQPDQGFEVNRFTGIPVFDSLMQWDLSSADKPSVLVRGLAIEWTASVSGTGTWSCAGSNGGANASCSAPAACSVSGGTALSPTSLTGALANVQCTQFNLGDGHYAAVTITRPNIIIKAVNKCAAIILPELSIQAQNITVDGVSVTAAGNAITIYNPGVRVLNSCIQGFGKTQYGNGIWIFQEALDPNNKIIIEGNELSDWGGNLYSGGIAIGKADDNYAVPSAISVEVRSNRITDGPTQSAIYNAAIQAFHPFLAYKNYIHTVSGTSFQNKTFNSRVACNEMVNVIGDGAMNNRLGSNNLWEYNIVHDSDVGIDHFMGDGTVFRGNVIYNVDYFGRVKDQGIGSTNLTFENNTFYNSSAWASFIWDNTSGAPLNNILWRKNIFHTASGISIASSLALDPVWDETLNIFFNAVPPTGTTGDSGTSLSINPNFVNPPSDFTAQEPSASGKGAPWPLPCP